MTLCTTTPALFGPADRPGFDRAESRVRLSCYGADCYAYRMLAAGQIDLLVETCWDGERAEHGGRIVAAANAGLHAAAMVTLHSR